MFRILNSINFAHMPLQFYTIPHNNDIAAKTYQNNSLSQTFHPRKFEIAIYFCDSTPKQLLIYSTELKLNSSIATVVSNKSYSVWYKYAHLHSEMAELSPMAHDLSSRPSFW